MWASDTCAPCLCSAYGGQKGMLILLTLESHMVLSHLIDSANSTYFSARTASAFSDWAIPIDFSFF